LTNPTPPSDAVGRFEAWSPLGIDAAASGLRLERSGAVVRITLDRPSRRNAQRPETWHTLDAIGRALPGDVRVVVVTGAGPSFSAGIDLAVLSEMASHGLAGVPDEDTIASYQVGFTWLSRPDLVTVAAVAGHAVGAGFQLALACDLRILAEDAQFTMAETSRGLVPDLTGTEALVHHIGYARALEVCLTGRRIGAAEAKELGLANLVVPRDQLEAATDDLVAALLAAPREASIETKALLLLARASESERAAQHQAERSAQVRLMRGLVGDENG
jgi:enoyl-CoA hydratase/carnithine racemase